MSKKNPDAAKNIAGKILDNPALLGVLHAGVGAGAAKKIAAFAAADIAWKYRQEIADALGSLKHGIGSAFKNAPDVTKEVEQKLRQDLEKDKDKYTEEEYKAAEAMIPAMATVLKDVMQDKRTFTWVMVTKNRKDGAKKYHRAACNNIQPDNLPKDGSVKLTPMALTDALKQNIEEAADCNHMEFDAKRDPAKDTKDEEDPYLTEFSEMKMEGIRREHEAQRRAWAEQDQLAEERRQKGILEEELVLPEMHWSFMLNSSAYRLMSKEEAKKLKEEQTSFFTWLRNKFKRNPVPSGTVPLK